MITSMNHVGLSVADMQHSLKFYRDYFGMELLMNLDIADDRIARVIGIEEAKCKIVHLKLGETILELFEYTNPRGEKFAPKMRQCDIGFSHIGFEVNDIHRHIEELKQMGVEMLGEIVEFRPGVWVAYFRGPDGEVVEFRQQAEKCEDK